MSSLLDIARAALPQVEVASDISDQSPLVEITADPHESIRSGILAGGLAGWHIEGGVETEGLADWHAETLGLPHNQREG